MNTRAMFRKLTLAVALVTLAGCSGKSASRPTQTPSEPIPPPPVQTTTVTVTVSPNIMSINSTSPATVRVQVSRSDGQAIPDGSTVALSTSLGSFGSVGGPNSTSIVLSGGQGSTAFFAGATVGVATIQATFNSAIGTASVQIKEDTFYIASVSPATGSPDGGYEVNILGNGFASPARVTFNGVPANVQSLTPGRITVVAPAVPGGVPAGTTLPATVAVTIHYGQSNQKSDSLPSGFTYVNGSGGGGQPVVLSVTPATGPNEGGTVVTINGDGFSAPVQVLFQNADGSVAVEAVVQSVTRTQIVCTTPAATGFGQALRNSPVTVRVKDLNSGLEGSLANGFRYGSSILITSIGPGEGPDSGGTHVTIYGQGFEAPVAASAGGVAQQVMSVTGTEVQIVTVPVVIRSCADQTGQSRVTNISNGDTANGPNFTYRVARPIISNISPGSSGQNGGGTLTITGTGFSDPVQVKIGTSSATGAIVTPPQPPQTPPFTQTVKVTIPPFTGTFPTQACSSGGTAGTQNAPAAVDVVVTNAITTCTNTLAGVFQYLPSDTSCHVSVAAPVASFSGSCTGLTCSFVDTSTGGPTGWAWNFGDPTSGGANTSTLQNPTHTFSANGSFNVTLTASNAGGSSSPQALKVVTCTAGVCTVP